MGQNFAEYRVQRIQELQSSTSELAAELARSAPTNGGEANAYQSVLASLRRQQHDLAFFKSFDDDKE